MAKMLLLPPEPGIAGIDEAGRGPLAGPVAAAAVLLDPVRVPDGLNDSKKLGAARREALFDMIVAKAIATAIVFVPATDIDRLNIRAATLLAMRHALHALAVRPSGVLIDGRDIPDGLDLPARAIIGGDGTCPAIAAASILAKVARDRAMRCLDVRFPGYGFAQHMGYGTAAHLAALARLGPCPEHRMSFAPCRNAVL